MGARRRFRQSMLSGAQSGDGGAVMNEKRQNLTFDELINKGLAAALLTDITAGIRIMREGGIPPGVISRMFVTPQLRRGTDWKH